MVREVMAPGPRANRMSTVPVAHPRTLRGHAVNTLTSMPAGKIVPVFMGALLREDALTRAPMTFSFEMHETAEMLLNSVIVDVRVYLIPWLAMDRFESLDEFNKSYKGQPYRDGDAVIPFFETHAFDRAMEFYKYAGIHAPQGHAVNTMYLEGYNQMVNHRLKNRSPDLPLRGLLDTDLAWAFWPQEQYGHIVPDFDQARIDGEVPLQVSNPEETRLQVRNIGGRQGRTDFDQTENVNTFDADGNIVQETWTTGGGTMDWAVAKGDATGQVPDLYVELSEALGISVSLSNIEMARKTAAFARLREKYNQHSEEYLIDLLMDGITVPEQEWHHPMEIGRGSTIFGMAKRYSTSSGALDETAVNGATAIDFSVRTPRVPTGGVIMATAEITPEQLYERNKDYFFFQSGDGSGLPEASADELNPEKVAIVTNDWVDVDHAQPTDVFGYAPLNHEWDIRAPRVGGRFYRPEVNAPFDEDRQKIWAVETENPTLAQDFYLCTNIHTKPFADQAKDPFDCVVQGQCFINGLTVFGRALLEASDDYEKMLARVDQSRIQKPEAT